MHLNELVPILQMAIGPVILISGVGLFLLSVTNRYGRVIDRARVLTQAMRTADAREAARLSPQLDILVRRARLIRAVVVLATLSVLLTCVIIIALFVSALLHLEIASLIIFLFILCMGSLVSSLMVFLADINLSLHALNHEITSSREPV